MINNIWNGWKIEQQIGEGSFGKVYKISKQEFGDTYEAALKVIEVPNNDSVIREIRQEGMDAQSAESYFKSVVEDIVKEFSLMSKLKGHSNIVSYEDHQVIPKSGKIGWDIYIRMELLTPLYEYLEKNQISVKEVIKLGIDVCNALEVCQKYNIIHRDIKPENIFVSDIGSFKLGDFGIAKQSERAELDISKKGTYTYMAPEVYKGMKYDSTVDIYSLGIVMYKLLNNNRAPFMPQNQIDFTDREKANMRRVSGEKMMPPCNADARLSQVILKACAYLPQDRYKSPEEMKNDLIGILNGVDVVSQNAMTQDTAYGKMTNANIDSQLYIDPAFNGEEPTEQMTDDEFVVATQNNGALQSDESNDSDLQNNVNSDENDKNKKKILLVIAAIAIILVVGIVVFVMATKEKDKDVSSEVATTTENMETTSVEETDTVEVMTTIASDVIETTTEVPTTVSETVAESSAQPQIETTTVEETKEPQTEKEPEVTTPKKENKTEVATTKKEKQTTTKKEGDNKVPSQKEDNGVIGKENMDIIRNSVASGISGAGQSGNMKNLAIYMANNHMSDAKAAVDKVCRENTLDVACKTTTVTASSVDMGDITIAAAQASDNLSGRVSGDYGIGISVSFKNGAYHIYVVVVYEK